jgi:hypothetical protein
MDTNNDCYKRAEIKLAESHTTGIEETDAFDETKRTNPRCNKQCISRTAITANAAEIPAGSSDRPRTSAKQYNAAVKQSDLRYAARVLGCSH